MARSNCEPDDGLPGKAAKIVQRRPAAAKPPANSGPAKPSYFPGGQSKAGFELESTPQEFEALKKRIVAILRSSECAMMNFAVGRVMVTGRGYAAVADAVETGKIAVTLATAAGYEASYSPSTRTFQFPKIGYGVLRKERGSIVHEATHALIDIYLNMNPGSGEALSSSDEEPVCYIAECVFYALNVRESATQMETPESAHVLAMRRQAELIGNRIALDILNNRSRLLKVPPQANLADLGLLSHLIATHPEYQ
ncbi:MAG: hypothetical protein JNL56_13855 [Alphaproteobacteria bacterium]|nr:hypothetical protein [Alphaproteobacteria bacterium]